MENNKCNGLGGFPPLYKITEEYKKKREFSKNISQISKKKLDELNILSVKNILNTK
jgi:hypothetical protein